MPTASLQGCIHGEFCKGSLAATATGIHASEDLRPYVATTP